MELTHHLGESVETAEFLHDFPQSFTIHRVEGIRQIGPHLLELLLKLTGVEDHVRGPTMTTEAALAFRQGTLFQMMVQATEENANQDPSVDVWPKNAPVVVAELEIIFSLVKMDDSGFLELMGNPSLTSHLLEKRCRGTYVDAEERDSCFSCRTVDSLDHGEDTIPFVAIRAPLDLFGLASRPSVLHLVQPLLHKAATTAEGHVVVVGGAIYVGFGQSILGGEQVADGGIVVIEPVLVLASCVTEDSQDRRLDCVPQLTPSVLQGGFLVSGGDWKVGWPLSKLVAEMEMGSRQRQQKNIPLTWWLLTLRSPTRL
nr:unnamed protein product [Spirometra erinaceieuropaei]